MHPDRRVLRLSAFAAAMLLPAAALAQAPPKEAPEATPPTVPRTEQLDPKACALSGSQTTVGQGGDMLMEQNGSLSDRLARSDGVICPPEQLDSEIKAPTPPAGHMPVIPPPGSRGGDPSVTPK